MSYATGYWDSEYLLVGEETFPRRVASSTAPSTGSGNARFTFFRARKTETISQIRNTCGTAQVGATLCRIGVWEEDPSTLALNLVASTANDTSLWVAANTQYTKSFSSSFTKKRGYRYGVAPLIVGASTYPTFYGVNIIKGEDAVLSPCLGGFLSGLSDLPATIAGGTASLSPSSQMMFAILLP